MLLGNGDGTFGPPTSYPTGINPASVVVGDFNGDTNPDLAVANKRPGTVSILLGNGDGTFGAATNFPVSTRPDSVAIGDLNGDGKPDLAVANSGAYIVSILLGNGDGSFGRATPYGAGPHPYSVAIGDFNGDGNPDLAAANPGSYQSRVFHGVSILLGDGTGAFGAPKHFAAGFHSSPIAVGDLNGDNKPDLAVANGGSSNVSVLLGDGTGSFAAPKRFRVGDQPSSVAIGDLNGDGKPDLAVANAGSNNVSVLLNGGPAHRTLTLSYHPNKHRFTGRLKSGVSACVEHQTVKVLRRRHGRDQMVGAAHTTRYGTYTIRNYAGVQGRSTTARVRAWPYDPGTYYARVRAWSACRGERSKTITIG